MLFTHCDSAQHRIQRPGRGGARNMKSMWPPLAAIFFMTYLYRAGGAWPPLGTPPGSTTATRLVVAFLSFLMAPSHCTGTGLGTMGLYIMLLTVHTTPKPGTGLGMGLGTNGLHTHFPIPVLVPGIGQCV